jgi:hypothetical protein
MSYYPPARPLMTSIEPAIGSPEYSATLPQSIFRHLPENYALKSSPRISQAVFA